MKIGIIGDLHFGVNENKESFINYHIDSFKWIINTMKEQQVDCIVQLGDFFDKRKYIDIRILNIVNSLLTEYDMQWYVLSGNHDTYYKNSNEICSLRELLRFDNFKVIVDVPEEISMHGNKFLFVPWVNKSNLASTTQMIEDSTANIVFGHLEFKGFDLIKGITCRHDQINRSLFNKFKYVFSGHFHLKSNEGNIVYTGTPVEMTWDSADDKKGIIVYDTGNESYEYFWNPYKYFYKIVINSEEDIESLDIESLQNKNVKVFTNVSNAKFDVVIEKIIDKSDSTSIIDNSSKVDDDVDIDVEGLEIVEVWTEYTEQLDMKDTDRKNINKLFEKIYTETIGGQ